MLTFVTFGVPHLGLDVTVDANNSPHLVKPGDKRDVSQVSEFMVRTRGRGRPRHTCEGTLSERGCKTFHIDMRSHLVHDLLRRKTDGPIITRCTLNFPLRSYLLTALFSLLLVLTTSSVQAATWTSLDVPGGHDTAAAGINLAGDIVGIYLDSADAVHGFLLHAGTYTTIDVPSAINSNPYAIMWTN